MVECEYENEAKWHISAVDGASSCTAILEPFVSTRPGVTRHQSVSVGHVSPMYPIV